MFLSNLVKLADYPPNSHECIKPLHVSNIMNTALTLKRG